MTAPTDPLDGKPASYEPQRVAQNTAWNAADLVVALVLGTITSIVVARGLGPSLLGSYQFVVWMASIVATVSLYGVPIAASRNIGQYLAAGETGLAGALLRKTFQIQAIIALIALVGGFALVFTMLPAGERAFGFVAFLAIIPSLFMAIPTSINALDDRFDRNVVPSITGAILESTGAVLVVVFDGGLLGLAAATLIARTVDCTVRTAWAWPRMHGLLRVATVLPVAERAQFVRMAKEAALMQVLAFAVWNRSEILFLEWFSTKEQIAFFSLAFGFSTRIALLPIAAARTLAPAILRSHGVDPLAAVRITARSVRIQSLFAYPLFGALVICAAPLIGIMYGATYHPAIVPVMILAAASAIPSGRSAFESLLRAADHQRAMVKVYLAMTVLTLVADWLLIRAYGAIGAAIANGSIVVLQGAVLFFLVRRLTSLRWSDLRLGRLIAIATIATSAAWLATTWCTPVIALILRPLLVIGLFTGGLLVVGGLDADERRRLSGMFGEFWRALGRRAGR